MGNSKTAPVTISFCAGGPKWSMGFLYPICVGLFIVDDVFEEERSGAVFIINSWCIRCAMKLAGYFLVTTLLKSLERGLAKT